MKVALAVCNYAPYRAGITNVAERHAAHLRAAGHEVFIVCPDHEHGRGLQLIDGIPVRRLRSVVRHGNSALVPGIGRAISPADVLYLHYPFYGGAEVAAFTAHARGIPYVVFFHMDVIRGGVEGRVLRLYERSVAPWLLRRAETVFVSSMDYAEHSSIARYRLSNLQEFPYAIDTDRYRPDPVSLDERRRLGLDPGRRTILFVGAMDRGHSFKGVQQLIEAVAAIDPGDGLQLALVGDGNLRPDFERIARTRIGIDGARFLGRVAEDDLRMLYRAADVLALPSTTGEEAFGVVLIEAMASGTPVIASDLPGVRALVTSDTGRLVPPGDVPALSNALSELLGDDVARARMAASSREWAVDRFSQRRERAQLEETFSSLESPSSSWRGRIFRSRR